MIRVWLWWHQLHGIVVLRRRAIPAATGPLYFNHTLACECGSERSA